MPRPPILPLLDWKSIVDSGTTWEDWLGQAESDENRQKMQAAFENQKLDPTTMAFLQSLPRDVHVVAIAEGWCGDVHRHAPVLAKLAVMSGRIHLRFITREQHREVFARFLTNGGEAIPKFVFLSDQFIECGNWGPMPHECRRIIARGKATGEGGKARERVSGMYESDPNCEIVVRELMEIIETATCLEP
ncbi:thioredoxin family protein [bacterium]|nr:thioredoxin family protein [bacterium]